MSLMVKYYKRPNGSVIEIEFFNIHNEDQLFFIENNINLSIEDDPAGGFIIYGGSEKLDEEVIVLSRRRDAFISFKELRTFIEDKLNAN